MVSSLFGLGDDVLIMFVLPRSLAIASFSKACSLRVGARPSMPTTMLAFGPLMYVFKRFMVPSFSGSGIVMGEMSPREGEGRGCSLLLGMGSGEEGEVGLPLFLLIGVGGGISICVSLDPDSSIIFRGFRVPDFPPLLLGVDVFIKSLGGFKMGCGLPGMGVCIVAAPRGEPIGSPVLSGEAVFRHTCPDGRI